MITIITYKEIGLINRRMFVNNVLAYDPQLDYKYYGLCAMEQGIGTLRAINQLMTLLNRARS
ncbi:MAG: hypothetical protein HY753_09610 [Nitrospirae bacterium]|nr:hypothetical protein [Nitrospirota bacterium]